MKNEPFTKSIKLLTTDGTLLKEIQAQNGFTKYDFDLSDLSAGFYIVLIEEDNRLLVSKVFKCR